MTREEAIEKLKRWKLEVDDEKDYAEYLEGWFYKDDEIAFDMAIEALQEQKIGKWIGGELGNCSVCGHKGCASDIWDRCAHTYCPNCGAKLEV